MADYTLLTLNTSTGAVETTTHADAMALDAPDPAGCVTGWQLACGTVACRSTGYEFDSLDRWRDHYAPG